MALAVAAWDRREDLIFEGYANITASGGIEDLWSPDGITSSPAITTPWHSSAGINTIRVVANYNGLSNALGSFSLEEADFFGNTVGSPVLMMVQSVPVTPYPGLVYAEFKLTARMFSFTVNGGTPGDNFPLTVRSV